MARDAELRARITAKDDASKVIDKVADAAADLEDHPVEVEVSGNVRDALSALDQVAAEAKLAAEAAEALGRALGPELAAKADPGAIVGDLQRMGLSLDEITANADELGAKMRDLADADVGGKLGSSLGTARGKLDEVSKSADSSKSALANMVGNSSQSLGQLAGVTGDLGVGVGQLGEYFADAAFSGEGLGSVIKNMAGVVGPMAALGVATAVLASHMQKVGETKAFEKQRVQDFAEAMEDAKVSASELAEVLQAGKDTSGIFVRLGNETKNVDKSVAALFGTFQDFNTQVAKGAQGYDEWTSSQLAAAKAAGAGAQEMADLAVALAAARDGTVGGEAATRAIVAGYGDLVSTAAALGAATHGIATGSQDAAFAQQFYGDVLDDTAGKTEKSATATEWAADAQKELQGIAEKVAEALLAQADALNAQVDAATAAADQQLATNDALEAYAEVLGDAEASTDDVRDSAIDLAKAQADLKTKQAEANGVLVTSTQRLDNQNEALLNTAATAQGPARTAILDYIGSVNQIPPEKVTEIQAAIDAGDLATAKRLLDEASAPRRAAMQADANTRAAENELNETARDRNVRLWANVVKGTGWDAFQTTRSTTATATPGMAAAGTQTAAVPLTFIYPTGAQIARKIGPIRLPFSVASGLRADERLSGTRDL